MFDFFDAVINFFETLLSFIDTVFSSLFNLLEVVGIAITLPALLTSYIPYVLFTSLSVVIGFAVVKIIVGR